MSLSISLSQCFHFMHCLVANQCIGRGGKRPVVKLCSPYLGKMIGVDSCVFFIFTTRVGLKTRLNGVKSIFFEQKKKSIFLQSDPRSPVFDPVRVNRVREANDSAFRTLDFGVGISWLRGHPQGPESRGLSNSGGWLPATSGFKFMAQVSLALPYPEPLRVTGPLPAFGL